MKLLPAAGVSFQAAGRGFQKVDNRKGVSIMMSMVDYELIDHTADIGIRVRASDLRGVFKAAAKAMFHVIAEPVNTTGRTKRLNISVAVEASGQEELLIRWLNELLSLADCKDVFFTEFKITDFSPTMIKADVSGLSRKYFNGKREIKAVTYHEMLIQKQGSGYFAEVIFDV